MTRIRLINTIIVLWAVVFVLSFAAPFFVEPTGDGFTRGANRIAAFLIWQGIAFAIASVVWLLGAGVNRDRNLSRWLNRIPMMVHLLMVLLVVGLVLFARFSGPPASPSVPPGPVTVPSPNGRSGLELL